MIGTEAPLEVPRDPLDAAEALPIADDEAVALYRTMLRIRCFETRAGNLFAAGEIPGFIHLSIGQEASAAATAGLLRRADQITATHRGHGHIIAKGAAFAPMMAELMGRTGGYCGGKGGSMHIFSREIGVLGANAILGASQPIAVGAALADKLAGGDRVVMTFFGEGAASEGAVHEAMVLAGIWSVPVLFVIEVNGYAELTPFAVHSPVPALAVRGAGYGIDAATTDDRDPFALRAQVRDIVDRMRVDRRPYVLEIRTTRWHGHFEGDQQRYRDPAELVSWRADDTLERARLRLEALGVLDDAAHAQLLTEIDVELSAAVEFARASPRPADEALFEQVYSKAAHD